MNIGIDVDGVLTDYEFYLDYFAKKLDSQVCINPCGTEPKKRFDWSDEQVWRFYKKYFLWYVKNMPIRVNVAATLKELKKEGHNVYIITARAYADRKTFFGWLMRVCLKHWLKRNEVPYDGLYFVDMENSPEEKANLIKKLNIDCFIEDTPENIEKMKEYCKVICIKAGYNRDLTGVTYANDFYDVYAIINHQPVIEQLHGNPSMQRQYYDSLPYDEGALHQYKRNTQLAIKTLGTLLKCFIKLEIVGQENIPKEGGVVFACNHRRSMDIPIMYLALRDNYARFLIKMEYELSKFRFLQKPLGTIYVNRESKYSSRTARTSMVEALLHGTNVLIFPEGTRNRTSEILLPFRFGAVRVAKAVQTSVVPIVIKKTGKRSYKVVIGQALPIGADDDLDAKNNELREKMIGLLSGE